MSAPEDLLAFQLKAVGIPFEREVQFAKPRRWRADFVLRFSLHVAPPEPTAQWPMDCCQQCFRAWPVTDGSPCDELGAPLLIEIDGGTWSGGRHVSGSGFEADCIKLNAATLAGYRVLRFTPSMVDSGAALAVVEEALGVK